VAMVEMIMWSKEILIMEVALIDVLDVKWIIIITE
jgi:hypothetical protein